MSSTAILAIAMASRGRVLRLGAAMAAVLALAGCGEKPAPVAPPAPRFENGEVVFPEGSRQLAAFTMEQAVPGGTQVVELAGRIVWDEDRTVRVYPPMGGRVQRILARAGDPVKPGQVLAVLASPDFGQAQAEARRAQADLGLAEKNLARLRELHAAGVVARKDLHAAEADQARAESESARALGRARLYGSADSVDQSLALRSPVGGVLVERNINPGQELRTDAQSGPAMFVVTDPARLWVMLDANERDLPLLQAGQKVKLTAGAWPGESFAATVQTVSDAIDPATRTVKVRGVVYNAQRKLKGEMYVRAEIDGRGAPGLQVPSKSVFLFNDRYYAFVQSGNGRFRMVEVKVGAEHGGKIDVMSGLDAGQMVVVEGSLFLLRIQRQLQTGAPV